MTGQQLVETFRLSHEEATKFALIATFIAQKAPDRERDAMTDWIIDPLIAAIGWTCPTD